MKKPPIKHFSLILFTTLIFSHNVFADFSKAYEGYNSSVLSVMEKMAKVMAHSLKSYQHHLPT